MPGATTSIVAENIHYDQMLPTGVQTVVGPLSLTLQGGEFLSVVGPSGCGKSALLKMIAGIRRVSGGVLRVSGTSSEPPCRDFGVALEEPALLPWRTSLENILLPAEIRGLDPVESANRARRLLAWFDMSRYENCWPDELPPGAACAVSICRALIHGPALLLLDDPFRAIDPLSSEQMLDRLQRLWAEAGCASLLCTGNLVEAVLLSDRVAVMSAAPGRILDIIPIDLPRPRRLDRTSSPLVADYCSRIRVLFRAQGILH